MKTNKNYNILYVDDEKSNLRVFKNVLRRKFNIKTTNNAEDGLKIFKEGFIDLVIADQRMPSISGLEFLSMIKKLNPLIPTILLTGYTDYDVLKKAFNEVGVHKYVNKPFDPDNMSTMIELAVETYHLKLKQEQMQSVLQESEAKFRGIFNSMADVFVRVNNDSIIEVISPSIEELAGYKPAELIGRNVEVLYKNPESRKQLVEKINKDGFYRGAETILLTKSGEEKYISSTSKRFYDENGNIKGIESIVIDVNERKKMTHQLKELNEELENKVIERTRELVDAKMELEKAYKQEKELSKLKSQFVSTASHQFRTPLTVIQSNIGLLEMQFENIEPSYKAKFDKVYERIQSEVKRMTELMDNVLILGKRDVGAIKVNMQMIDLLKVIKAIINKYNQIQEDQREIKLEFSGSPALFYLDLKLFEHAFSNLISNAFKYSKNKPSPEVKVKFSKENAIITVEDFGVGIPDEDKSHIFEPFFRATNVSGINGTGLGTSITKEYLDLMGAEINIESELNKGTKFIIHLKR